MVSILPRLHTCVLFPVSSDVAGSFLSPVEQSLDLYTAPPAYQ